MGPVWIRLIYGCSLGLRVPSESAFRASSSDVACRASAASLFRFAVENTRKFFGPAVDVAPVILLVLAPFQRLDANKAALTLTMTLMVIALPVGLRSASPNKSATRCNDGVGSGRSCVSCTPTTRACTFKARLHSVGPAAPRCQMYRKIGHEQAQSPDMCARM